ncbi:MAG: hypothetical protein HC878_19040 [Leptolyngbyaceae cyanobacterium SL_5_14]|nr:hypothetical protein [Leptolyngbyaceae cyanobacterium SL_5_14]
MDLDVRAIADEFQKNHSIWDLGYLLQFLKLGMYRWEVENLLGEPTTFHPHAGCLYSIAGLRRPVEVDSEEPVTMPAYLQVEFEGDEGRRQTFGESETIKDGLATDKLLSFAIRAIGE